MGEEQDIEISKIEHEKILYGVHNKYNALIIENDYCTFHPTSNDNDFYTDLISAIKQATNSELKFAFLSAFLHEPKKHTKGTRYYSSKFYFGKIVKAKKSNLDGLCYFAFATPFSNWKQDNNKHIHPHLVKLLDEDISPSNLKDKSLTFRDYLKSKNLPYYSREEFKKNLNPDEQESFYNEIELKNFLIKDDFYGLIIHGEGGIGKTRLVHELGYLFCKDLGGYEVIEVLNTFNDIEWLIAYIDKSRNYILLFDYIEEQQVFDDVVDWITKKQLQNIKVIANCRNGLLDRIKIKADSDYFKYIDIGLKQGFDIRNKIEYKYKQKVIKSIIKSIDDKNLVEKLRKPKLLKFYQSRPSFAVFIKYLHYKNRDTDFSISHFDKFEDWLWIKLQRTILGRNIKNYNNFFYIDKKEIFIILCCLPSTPQSYSNLLIENSIITEIEKLKKDGWVDETDEKLRAVHDTVVDTLLLNYFKKKGLTVTLIKQFLEFGVKYKSISSMMFSFQRIIIDLEPPIKTILKNEIATFIEKNLNESLAKEYWFENKIDTTSLLEEKRRICIFYNKRDVLTPIFANEKFGSALGFSMQWINDAKDDELDKEQYKEWLKQLFVENWNIDNRFDSIKNNTRSAKIISPYINLYGIDDFITDWCNRYITKIECNLINLENISLVLTSWLNQKGTVTTEVKELAKKWFDVFEQHYPEKINCGYLLGAWIEYGNDLKIVESLLNYYLKNNEIYINNRANIISAWLQRSENINIVEFYIQETLSQEIYHHTAYNIITNWFQKGGNSNIIKPILPKWLNSYPIEPQFYFILINWLNYGDDDNLLIDPINRWINKNAPNDYLQNVLGKYLEKNQSIALFEQSLLNWLNNNYPFEGSVYLLGFLLEKLKEFHFLIKNKEIVFTILNRHLTNELTGFCLGYWIERTIDLHSIKMYMEKWLLHNPKSIHSCNVISSWLSNKGDYNIVKEYILKYLEQHVTVQNSSKLMFNWLKFGDESYLIKEYVQKFFLIDTNCQSYESSYLIIYWLEKTNGGLLIKNAVLSWLEANKTNSRALTNSLKICILWIEKGDDINFLNDYLQKHIVDMLNNRNTIKLFNLWMDKNCDLEVINLGILKLIENKHYTYILNKYFIKWINSKKTIEGIESLIPTVPKSLIDELLINDKGILKLKDNINERIIEITSNDTVALSLCNQIKKQIEIEFQVHNQPSNLNEIKIIIGNLYNNNCLSIEWSYIITGWIEYANDFEFIKSYLIEWLEKFPNDFHHLSFVVGAALLKPESFDIVKDYALELIIKNKDNERVKFLLSSWLSLKGNEDSLEIQEYIFHWKTNFYSPNRHNWRDTRILDYIEWYLNNR